MKTTTKTKSKKPMPVAVVLPPRQYQNMKGKWVEKVTKSTVLLCVCGNKYLKTRPGQTTCVPCLVRLREIR
ncbi:MAG: hypothetical protein PHS53_04525 [Candidatus Pacebacteria bacterium]|nr:hypothetical protein [Candidatus Paceibacterota bacterium]MDD5357384.1 hypothetical protein [Candidatus Paceibacterota bacterium]